MKTTLISCFILFVTISCFGQEVEFCGSFNTSSEQRFQNAYGVGLQYQHELSQKWKIGFGVHYTTNAANFDHIPYVDADPLNVVTDKINSSAKRFSVRLNLQRYLKNNENLSLTLGPEISCNYLEARDQTDRRTGQLSNQNTFSENYRLSQRIGIGFISKIEIKDFIAKPLALCFTIRPEFIIGDFIALKGSDQSPFYGLLGFTEFQIGLAYRFKK